MGNNMFYYVNAPRASMKKSPQEKSETVSETYFSEEVELLDNQKGWAFIETITDSYRGWVSESILTPKKNSFLSDPSTLVATVNRCSAHVYNEEDTIYGPIITLPFESKLKAVHFKDLKSRWIEVLLIDGRKGYIQRGDITLKSTLKNLFELGELSLQFLNLPYTWGGRSSFGYDCSGFTQMLYRQMGVHLPRDAKEQISYKNFSTTSLEKLKTGDLLFWGQSSDLIGHVGMYLTNKRFIHATVAENAPYIRVSYLSDPEWNGCGKWSYRAFKTLN